MCYHNKHYSIVQVQQRCILGKRVGLGGGRWGLIGLRSGLEGSVSVYVVSGSVSESCQSVCGVLFGIKSIDNKIKVFQMAYVFFRYGI